ncbi:reverse transcriptase domain-containing protein [Tanacetum coccineum]
MTEGWGLHVSGFHMFRVVKKLKCLKKPLRKLLYEKGNLYENVNNLRVELEKAQLELDSEPSNFALHEKEAEYVRLFTDALLMEERFLKQKFKVEWLKVGDSNSSYFHKLVKGRVSRHQIDVVTTLDGDLVTDVGVPTAFVSHYEAFLGQSGYTIPLHAHDLFMNRLHPEVALDMVNPVTAQEVKEAIFSMGNDKSLGPDGYTACFFKESWDIMASDVILVVQEFFVSGKLLKELNHTIIALIPKLMHNYHLDRSSPRCAFKVDIQKAYETMDWGFLKEVLIAFGFHDQMVGKRGIRQGDPLSPYLFTIIMEVLTLILQRRVCIFDDFLYHRYCSNLELVNLCFVDDLFLFAHGDSSLARVIMEALDEFKNSSGLTPSLPKSMAYFCNVLNHMKLSILQILPFDEGRLPVKYLGVPLVTSRLVYRDCKELLERIRSRIKDWKNKSLSAAGRLQLARSVISSMHVYWASVRGKAKVLWEVVCLPKKEGGLGLRRLELFNKALMVSHIWNLLVRKESLWVKWIHEYKLRGRHFFEIPCRATCSLWFDRWSPIAPLADVVTSRDIHRAGFGISSKVKDVVFNGGCSADVLEWRNNMGEAKNFSVAAVWNCIRPRSDEVDWCHVVWFSNCIPHHAFHLWLVARRRLKTHDMLRQWDFNGSLLSFQCPLCDGPPDSHEHLFFECSFSSQVWGHMRNLAGLSNVAGSIQVIVDTLIPFLKRRSARSVVAKLVVAACSYFIWQEQNSRLFNNQTRSFRQVIECIKSLVSLKLLSCYFKKSRDALFFKQLWELLDSIIRNA